MRYFAIVGTKVRDRINEASMAMMTASAIGLNKYPATPPSSKSGIQTIAMQRVATRVGTTI
jgi:hypothetical protein